VQFGVVPQLVSGTERGPVPGQTAVGDSGLAVDWVTCRARSQIPVARKLSQDFDRMQRLWSWSKSGYTTSQVES